MHTQILVAHPYKHHALHLAAGCAQSGRTTAFALPFYRTGLGAAVARIPGAVGRKAAGYFHPGLVAKILQSPVWQLRKLMSFLADPRSIEMPYDRYVARQILTGKWSAQVVVTLQDHMPLTSAAARQTGAVLWSDQIINSSAAARARIAAHSRDSHSDILKYPEEGNTRILAMADIVTAPSAYTLQGIVDRIGPQAKVHSIPYGVDTRRFDVEHVVNSDVFMIVARANTVRKGGHLLLEALLRFHEDWAQAIHPRRLQIVILGSCEPQLAELFAQARRIATISLRDGDVPNVDVPALFARSDLLVMPTLSEGMSLACVEAMRAGVPLVITAYAGLDCFVPGEMGLCVEDTVESVGAAVTRVLEDPAQLDRWRTNVREVAQGLTWDRYEAAIAKVAAGCVA